MASIDVNFLAAVAEIVASIAVVVSLLFVAFSIKQNTAAVQAANENFLYELQYRRLGETTTNEELASIIVKFSADEQLSDVEAVRYSSWAVQDLGMWEIAYLRHKEGLLPSEQWKAWDRAWTTGVPKSFPEEWWQTVKHQFGDEFVQHVETAYSRDE
ncbi:MAG: hypothetical protein MI725_08660 [Pirellulales bacterium]|nr:hypothetical protein [Pirellulales bacterium]